MGNIVLALGFFDGIHLGHSALLNKTKERAAQLGLAPAVFTFDRHPRQVITGKPTPLINSAADRQEGHSRSSSSSRSSREWTRHQR